MRPPLTVGAAGHVDHGKTALVEALTSHDTDRLAEEKRRGLSIDLGFAPLDLGEHRLSLIDVPGHERFVRTMIAGATGIDMFLLVIAADDGVMPQTREHLTVLRALDVEWGVVAITKCDLVDRMARDRAREQARALIPDAPLVEVSSVTGEGVPDLRDALAFVARTVERPGSEPTAANEEAVLHVDRAFTVAGRGTVVTGTLWSGSVRRGGPVTVLPQGIDGRAREVQVHGESRDCAEPRQRVALNLAGIRRDEVHRGDVVASAGCTLRSTYRLDVEIAVQSEPLVNHERAQVHHGTREAPGRLILLDNDLVQIRLEAPLIARDGDRLVLRRISSPATLGGGRILDAHPRRHGPGPAVKRLVLIREGKTDQAETEMAWPTSAKSTPEGAPDSRCTKPSGATPFDMRVLGLLRSDGAMPRAPGDLADALGVEKADVVSALDNLVAAGEAVRIKPTVYFPASELGDLRREIVELVRERGSMTLAQLRDELGISRKYAQALLEHLDACKQTLRKGDERVLRRRNAVDREDR